MDERVEKRCETCFSSFYGPSWASECDSCKTMREHYPAIMRWVVDVIDQRIKATLPQPMKCDVCGRHPSTIFTTGKGTFCQEHSRI